MTGESCFYVEEGGGGAFPEGRGFFMGKKVIE